MPKTADIPGRSVSQGSYSAFVPVPLPPTLNCDVLIVGAGFAGMVLAERLASIGKKCIIVDKRNHIGGNAYDMVDSHGVLIHPYGPHLFHTNSDRVFEYLSQFTKWIPATYTSSSYTRGRLWSFPINLKTFEQLQGKTCTTQEMEEWLAERRVDFGRPPQNSEEAIVSQVGVELYEMFYKNYVIKQWHRHPKELAASVCQRLPIRTTRNDLYFDDKHQCMPAEGYTEMFRRMCPESVEIILGCYYLEPAIHIQHKHLVFTGPIDEFFNCINGPLPYRSLRFEHHMIGPVWLTDGFYQPTVTVNFPNDHEFTRITEIKHVTGQQCANSTIIKEYPATIGEPYYPIPAPETAKRYAQYKALAEQCSNVTFVGRLARYAYQNMDATVAQALHEFEILKGKLSTTSG